MAAGSEGPPVWAGSSRTFLLHRMWESEKGSCWAVPTSLPHSLLVLCPPPGAPDRPWGPLTFNPRHLTVAEGDTATFTCSFSNTSTNFVLNWYRMSPRNQMDKLAAFPEDSSQPGRDQRFRVTQLPNGRDFRMSVLTARQNDSGIYLCGAIHLFPDTKISESPHANLTVTGEGLGHLRVGVRPRSRGDTPGVSRDSPGSTPGLCPMSGTMVTNSCGPLRLEAPQTHLS